MLKHYCVFLCMYASIRGASPPKLSGDFSISDLVGNLPPNLQAPPVSGNNILAQDDIPGQPLNPDDYRTAYTLADEGVLLDETFSDPITLAGLFEGDIDNVSQDHYFRILHSSSSKNDTATTRNAIRDPFRKWPNGIVPYVISNSYNARERGIIAKAISEYHEKTCIRFVPRTRENSYVHIMRGSGCSSSVGRTGGSQTVSLGMGCVYTGIVIHELMHAVGFWHEQSRYDRDDHITIIWNNIIESMTHNFLKYDLNKIDHLDAPYDTCSVMHYGPTAFAKRPRLPTIKKKHSSSCQLGQRNGFSEVDIKKINALYGCGKKDKETTESTTVKPNKKVTEKCMDTNKFCPTWSKMGECEKNPAWMLKYCQISCGECSKKCVDHNPYCDKWAKNGECGKNADYMDLFCLKACGKCKSDCKDENKHCQVWMQKGYCKRGSYKDYMKLRCRKSCRFC